MRNGNKERGTTEVEGKGGKQAKKMKEGNRGSN